MKTFKMKSLATAAAAAALGFGMASSAHALQYNVTLYSTASTANFANYIVNDGGIGDSDGLVNSSISLDLSAAGITKGGTGTFTGYSVVGSLAAVTDTTNLSFISSSSSTVKNSSGGTVRAFVVVSDDGNTPPRSTVQGTGSGTFAVNLTGANMNMYWYDDPSNGIATSSPSPMTSKSEFDTFVTSLNLAGASGAAGNKVHDFSYDPNISGASYSHNWGPAALVPPDLTTFSQSLIFDFTLANDGQLISRGQTMTKQVPEPATMSLLGAGLMGLAAARRRKAKAKAKEQDQVQA